MAEESIQPHSKLDRVVLRHLRFGWWCLLVYLILGIVLESLHAFKAGFYLDVDMETRRLMFRLAHAHGTLLALVNILFAITWQFARPTQKVRPVLASPCLMSAAVLMPVGFFLGGLTFYRGDPGVGIFVVPVGGLLLLFGVFGVAWSLTRNDVGDSPQMSPSGPAATPKRRRPKR